MTEPTPIAPSLAAEICRDLGQPVSTSASVIARAALGPLATKRLVAVNNGRLGRAQLLRMLSWSREVLDADLAAPSPWRGPSRNTHAARRRENTPWLGASLTELAARTNLGCDDFTAHDLLGWNRVAASRGEWRTRAMRVDGYRVPFSPAMSGALVAQLLDRANRRDEPAPLAAARLHVGLLLAHPFRDGNGRTARLAAAAVLLRDGTKGSLQTCVEQHHHLAPAQYGWLMGRLRRREIGVDAVVDGFLGAMAGRSLLAAWVVRRHEMLLAHATSLDCPDPVAAVRCFEVGDCPSPLSTHDGQPLEPWHRLRPHLQSEIAGELRSQLSRAVRDRA